MFKNRRNVLIYSLTSILILVIMSLNLIAINVSDKKQESLKTKELIYLEKTTDYFEPSLIFESKNDEKYYLVEISDWQYDNTTYQKGDVVELQSKKAEGWGPLSLLIMKLMFPGIGVPVEEVLILDDWKGLFILANYRTSDRDLKENLND